MELETYRDFNKLGAELDNCINALINREYGIYSIKENDIRILTIVSNMGELQRHLNKGIKLIGWEGKQQKIEVYDYRKRQDIMDRTIKDFYL